MRTVELNAQIYTNAASVNGTKNLRHHERQRRNYLLDVEDRIAESGSYVLSTDSEPQRC